MVRRMLRYSVEASMRMAKSAVRNLLETLGASPSSNAESYVPDVHPADKTGDPSLLMVTLHEVNLLHANRIDIAFVDVREPVELVYGIIPGAHLIPLAQLKYRTDELPTERELVVYCASGSRALRATRMLRELGFRRSRWLQGGYSEWQIHGGVPGKMGNA